jgi:hypothetical protein
MIPSFLIRPLLGVLAAVALIGAVLLGVRAIEKHGYDRHVAEVAQERLRLLERTEQKTADVQAEANKILKEKTDALNDTSARLDVALDELRKRPARRSGSNVPSGTGACAGASGAELSGPDAGFLAREAARGDRLRASLAQCYRQYEEVKKALTP